MLLEYQPHAAGNTKMPTPAKVVVLPQEEGVLEVIDLELPDPGPHQVVVKQYASGICHSQLHQMHNPRVSPVILGHESTGIVLKVGSEVTHVTEGDTVLVTWVPRDAANTSRVPNPVEIELPGGDIAKAGNVFTWADTTISDEQYVVKVSPDINKEVTAIIGCAVMTGAGAVEHTAAVKEGDSVVIFGVGGVGLSAVVAARTLNANPIIAVDLDAEKLKFAAQFGATHTINASETDPIRAIRELTTDPDKRSMRGTPVAGADFAFDCIGLKQTMEQIVPAVRNGFFGAEPGGTAVLVGVPQTTVELNAADILVNEKKFIGSIGGSCSPDRDFRKYLEWYDQGLLDLDALVTERFSIDQINEATSALENGEIAGRAIMVF
ncbi:MAG: alcohol dehydrogenase [Gammaproteobacteria bacterium]|jgi:Zn-dependent alcohol dehydrogenase|nr:alcohol dehydrogenase [Gammaproteobacteria bacterium]MBP20223.1 alcohol dehydrogenase [Gammaproteobacteria bacterium]|tara:strand:+ start:3589 stop:4725 length:1137 start_codon:yes stop_codon:yes gene_type:complete